MRTIAFFATLALLTSCRGAPPKPDWKLYAGDSDNKGITRGQAGHTVKCDTAEIDDFVCMSYSDFARNTKMIFAACKTWYPSSGMSVSQLNQMLKDPLMRDIALDILKEAK